MSIPGSASPLFFQTAAADAAGGGPIKSVRFNQADSAGLYKNFSSAGNRRTWTFSCWIKKSGLYSTNSYQTIFESGVAKGAIQFDSIDQLRVYDGQSGGATVEANSVNMRDTSAWYHIVVKYDTTQSTASDRVVIYSNGVDITSTTATFPSQNYESAFSNSQNHYVGRGTSGNYLHGYLADVYFIDGSALDCTSFGAFDDNGVWQAAAYSGTFGTNGFHLFDFANESGIGNDSSGNDNDFTVNNITLSAVNYANAVATATNGEVPNGGTPYIVDVQPTNANLSYGSSPGIEEVFNGVYNSGYVYWVGTQYSSGNVTRARFDLRDFSSISTLRIYGGFSGYTAYNYQLLDSSKSAISGTSGSFGAIGWHSLTISGSPRYLEISCTSGSNRRLRLYAIEVNGTILTSSDPSNTDVLFDVPTNGDSSDDTGAGGELSSNYCVLNLLDQKTATLTNGNLEAQVDTDGSRFVRGTIAVSSGKWYWEFTTLSSNNMALGVVETTGTGNLSDSGSYYYYANGGALYGNSSGKASSWGGSSLAVGDVLGVALDMDAGTLQYYKNGSLIGTAWTGLTGKTLAPAIGTGGGSNNKTACNFGQRAWAYSAPTNFKALCTSNLPTPTIADGSAHFESKLYTGNGSTNALTMANSSMSPDIVWIHERSITGDYELFDSVRGANKVVESNSKNAQSTVANTLTSFDSNGFTLGSSSLVNDNNVTYVGWSWDSGSSNATNYTGSINSTVRANTAAGISIVTYTGTGSAATVGHSLGAVPEFIIIKNLDAQKNHIVYHAHMHSSPAEKAMNLNETESIYDSAGTFNDTAPTSTVFSVGTGAATNASGQAHRALCFAPVSGFSAMGRYDGTGDSNTGAFNYTGMRPAWVMIKRITNQESWVIYDTSRNTNNPTVSRLYSDLSNAESDNTSHFIDILSNGFKVRSGGGLLGASSNEYLWVAFAEHPFQANGGLAR